MNSLDAKWLKKIGKTWYVVREYPRPLQAALGPRFLRSLKTGDLGLARSRRFAALADFEAKVTRRRTETEADPINVAAIEYHRIFSAIAAGDRAVIARYQGYFQGHELEDRGEIPISPKERALAAIGDEVMDRADDLKMAGEAEDAERFLEVALGAATPVGLHIESWLAEGGANGPLKPRTRRQYQADLAEFLAWLRSEGIPETIQAVTRAIVGRYVTGLLRDGKAERKTINRKISAGSAYWRWLARRVGVPDNPWREQMLPKGSLHGPDKRPFTDAELSALLSGPADPELADGIRIAALSGMRIEELFRLTVADCGGGNFNIRQAKSKAGQRLVPIHSGLAAIVARRVSGKAPTDYLIHEAGGPPKPGRERSMPASKRFGRYRDSLTIGSREVGRRQNEVDFHSLRRWFVTKARETSDQAVVAGIVGHKVGNLTDDTYSGGPSAERRRHCVESVILPI